SIARVSASVEAENARKLKAAEEAFWAAQRASAAPSVAVPPAPTRPARKPKPLPARAPSP
ncbi:MAG TPA: hypothetical protein VEQ59_13025, partial [Polyangiaceae bacterium]|nr:hypothetical protein [Polyangiaceae bacterium]